MSRFKYQLSMEDLDGSFSCPLPRSLIFTRQAQSAAPYHVVPVAGVGDCVWNVLAAAFFEPLRVARRNHFGHLEDRGLASVEKAVAGELKKM
jgi:hypothetical protein